MCLPFLIHFLTRTVTPWGLNLFWMQTLVPGHSHVILPNSHSDNKGMEGHYIFLNSFLGSCDSDFIRFSDLPCLRATSQASHSFALHPTPSVLPVAGQGLCFQKVCFVQLWLVSALRRGCALPSSDRC